MNADIKARWVEALRSGNYAQGHGTLQDEGGRFCCLGVLTDLGVKEGLCRWEDKLPDGGDWLAAITERGEWRDADSTYTPEIVREWAGLKDHDPEVMVGGLTRCLSTLNDDGVPFREIADIIEQQL